MGGESVGVVRRVPAGDAVTAAAELRCALCGVRFRSTAEAETAHMRYGPEYVCAAGYECAARANRARDRRPGLAVVQPIGTVDEIK